MEETECAADGIAGAIPGLRGQVQTLYFTMIVFPPGVFEIGSTADEPNRQPNEDLDTFRIARQVAVCDRELTWQQLIAKEGIASRQAWSRQFSKNIALSEPVLGFHWFDSFEYCVWLTEQSGRLATGQGNMIPEDPEQGEWSIKRDRTGFRQPTEQEWEYACRSGTATSRQDHLGALIAFTVAGAGAIPTGSADRRSATGKTRRTGATTWDSAWPPVRQASGPVYR